MDIAKIIKRQLQIFTALRALMTDNQLKFSKTMAQIVYYTADQGQEPHNVAAERNRQLFNQLC